MDHSTPFIPAFDAAALGTSLFLLLLYLVIYESSARREHVDNSANRVQTQAGRNKRNMLIWAEKHNKLPDAPNVTLAIQSLRNTILVGIFIGGASLQYAVNACEVLRADVTPSVICRQLIIAALLFISFLNWTQVIRFANHAGYFIGTLNSHVLEKKEAMQLKADGNTGDTVYIQIGDADAAAATPESEFDTLALREVAIITKIMTSHFSYGLRFIYFTIPYFFYAAGPVALVVSGGLTLFFLCYFDLPRHDGHVK